jgi:leucyl-tRNA synthetase
VVEKMSKSRGNVVSPDDVVDELGADSLRLYEMFIGPLEKSAPWSTEGILGVSRFLHRAWRLLIDEGPIGGGSAGEGSLRELATGDGDPTQARLTAATIDGVTEDIEAMRFNTAISKLMTFTRDIAKAATLPAQAARSFVLLLSPFAPHLCEELWQRLGNEDSLAYEAWPEANRALLVEDTISLAVQVNGKRRDEITVARDAPEEVVREAALACEGVRRHLAGREPAKVIVVAGRLVNVVG